MFGDTLLWTQLKGHGGESPPNLENRPFRRAKTVVQCISAGKPTWPRAIGQLLLLTIKKVTDKTFSQGSLWHPTKNLVKVRPCTLAVVAQRLLTLNPADIGDLMERLGGKGEGRKATSTKDHGTLHSLRGKSLSVY